MRVIGTEVKLSEMEVHIVHRALEEMCEVFKKKEAAKEVENFDLHNAVKVALLNLKQGFYAISQTIPCNSHVLDQVSNG